jgi:hypothetical protein
VASKLALLIARRGRIATIVSLLVALGAAAGQAHGFWDGPH